MRVLFFTYDIHGSFWYRLYTPLSVLKEEYPGKFDFDFFDIQRMDATVMTDYDIFVIQRGGEPIALSLLETAVENGLGTIYDIDDAIGCIPTHNPAHEFYNQETAQDTIRELITNSHLMTVTTHTLKEYYEKRFYDDKIADKIRILPNCMDLKACDSVLSQKILVRPKNLIRMILTGGSSHMKDWQIMIPTFREIRQEFQDRVQLILFGCYPPGFEMDGVYITDSVPVNYYYEKLKFLDPDLCLVPLEPIQFNDLKSNLKFIEAGALGIPTVASFCKPYAETITHGKDGWLLDHEPYKWKKLLRKLVQHPDIIKRVGKEARRKVEQEYNLRTKCHSWLLCFNEAILRAGSKKDTLPIKDF